MTRRTAIALAALAAATGAQAPADVADTARAWCAQCHSGAEPEAGLDLPALLAHAPGADELGALRSLREQLASGAMPPDGEPQPPTAERARMLAWVERALAAAAPAAAAGRVTVRRLSRAEWQNAVFDLFEATTPLARAFPADDLGYGFDNIGDALSFSTLHLEKFAAAAADVARQAVVTEDPARPPVQRCEGEAMTSSIGERTSGEFAVLITRGELAWSFDAPRDGDYVLRARLAGDQAGSEPVRTAVAIDGEVVLERDVPQTRHALLVFEHPLRLRAGSRRVSIAFLNDYYDPSNADPQRRDRNLLVDWLELVGPVDPPALPRAHRWLFAADPRTGTPEDRARPIVRELLRRVWRRPAEGAEIGRLARLVDRAVAGGATFEAGIRRAVQAALLSPHFLFRIEPGAIGGSRAQLLDGHALATRLSFFLWSSVPDERLLELAGTGLLGARDVLAGEARRMLADPRASALAHDFAAQWLGLRALEEHTVDPARFGEFAPALRADLRHETELLVESILREKRSVRELLDADYTFLNARLAAHYGVPGIEGEHFRRVRVRDARRVGLLGHASVLAVTSEPTRTSPVRRGRWILDTLLGDPPPPPPPGDDSFREEDVGHLATQREKLAAHRAAPQCAVCHVRMDAFGLALENFDPVGRWRTEEAGEPIDARTALPGGPAFDGPGDLRAWLRAGNAFVRCLAGKLFVYGVGREPSGADDLALDALVAGLPPEPTFEELLTGIVQLDAFRKRDAMR
jgi:hypothetical protein